MSLESTKPVNATSFKNGVGYGKWTHIDGWSESVIEYIRALKQTAWVNSGWGGAKARPMPDLTRDEFLGVLSEIHGHEGHWKFALQGKFVSAVSWTK
jgi:hypothetical protein